ncbi:glycoside hydrolase family 16 protein [Pseudodesulfovibrio sediminis]|uniref:Hydrolase n=1 Tax=Pseudodesulfovibrio sediminis TaxID=2810563 RepID=A0ABM7P7Y1_9BACT|nr:glycoside hydrolase family 16 protein [Pseudodesulfovibrio sediminis]BCS89112.1 hydrolase [Pseudodesulfovibrio sediminis]
MPNMYRFGLLMTMVVLVVTSFAPAAMGAWELVLDEQFQDPATFGDRWIFEEGFRRNKELQYYIPGLGKNAVVGPEGITITAKKQYVLNSRYSEGNKYWQKAWASGEYTSASLKSKEYSIRNSKVEVVVRTPEGQGLWPAIWLAGERKDMYGEIDLMEIVGQKPNLVYSSIHMGLKVTGRTIKQVKNVFPNVAGNETTCVVELKPDTITLYVNDTEVLWEDRNAYDSTGRVQPLQQSFRLILNLALGGMAKELDEGVLPASYTIKSVRIWNWVPDSSTLK